MSKFSEEDVGKGGSRTWVEVGTKPGRQPQGGQGAGNDGTGGKVGILFGRVVWVWQGRY